MANRQHLAILDQGVDAWNEWRELNPSVEPDLRGGSFQGRDLRGLQLDGADLVRADLREADLSNSHFRKANFRKANLTGATLESIQAVRASFRSTVLARANLSGANLRRAYLRKTDLEHARLIGARLIRASMVDTNLRFANLSGSHIYGVSVWNVDLSDADQEGLVITRDNEPTITVDNLEVAQFVYLLLNNEKIRHVIDTITSKVVLILGRFSDDRKAVLDALRAELGRRNFTPILFDFDKPASKDVTGTVETLARLARFIIADLTDPSSVPHELGTIVPFLRTTPVLPLRLAGAAGYSMFEDLQKAYPWVLDTHEYQDGPSLIGALSAVIRPADAMARVLRKEEE